MEQFLKFDDIYYKLAAKALKKDIEDTGCLFPCTYMRYEVAFTRNIPFGHFGLGFIFGDTSTTIRKEYYIYPLISFISDLGGSLGLFVGFSFFMLWDILIELVLVISKFTSK